MSLVKYLDPAYAEQLLEAAIGTDRSNDPDDQDGFASIEVPVSLTPRGRNGAAVALPDPPLKDLEQK